MLRIFKRKYIKSERKVKEEDIQKAKEVLNNMEHSVEDLDKFERRQRALRQQNKEEP